MNKKNERYFELETILTITSGRIFTDIIYIFDILNYLTNVEYLSQFPHVLKDAQSYILKRYPELNGVGKDVTISSEQDVKVFIDEQKRIHGDSLALSPIPEYQNKDSIDIEMHSDRNR